MRWNSLIIGCLLIGFISCSGKKHERKEFQGGNIYRPLIHFTPPENWTNDPNGLVYYGGKYHLFYQYNPYGTVWDHMSWGHAVSSDLYDWKNLPVALPEYDSTMIFSGSAVVDYGNKSRLCPTGSKDCMVSVYTANVGSSLQDQCLAFSADSGQTWTRYRKNPVLDLGKKDFRDPNLFRYGNTWHLAVSLPLEHKILFYKTTNFVSWIKTGEFGNMGDTSKIWECPDMVKVPMEGSDSSYWVLFISSGSPYGSNFTGMQYFIGNFNGHTFAPIDSLVYPRWVDYGKDFYAALTYNNIKKGDPVMIGWVNNWNYANKIPTREWRGMMSCPRLLDLVSIGDQIYLAQKPLKLPEHFLDENTFETNNLLLDNKESDLDSLHEASAIIEVEVINQDAKKFGIKVFKSENYATVVGVNADENKYYIDRKNSGYVDFSKDFPSVESAPVKIRENEIRFDIIIDHSVIEFFGDNGATVMTEQVFPLDEDDQISLFAEGGKVLFKRVRVRRITL